ncbi:MAG: WG repeat-containing protein [Proteobacteria bacterium]|nr:WG repeat-containing protein [Pseudomonadota bacterium]
MTRLIILALCALCLNLSAQEKDINLMPYNDGKLWGYMDLDAWNNFEDKIIVIPARYEQAEDFYCGLARVKENGKFGYIDKTGQYKIFPYFNEGTDFENGVAFVKLGTKTLCLDTLGKDAEPPYQPVLNITTTSDRYTLNMDDRIYNPLTIPEGLSILKLKINW